MIIYDIEIKLAIKGRNEERILGVEYCHGWGDHKHMGVSCIAVCEFPNDTPIGEPRYRLFMDDNYDKFVRLVEEHETLISFNGINFDNKVITTQSWYPPDMKVKLRKKSFDILQEIWKGVDGEYCENFNWRVHAGYGLDQCIKANFPHLPGKTGHGAMAPVDYQKGNIGTLTDYCLADVWLTTMLFKQIWEVGFIVNPKEPDRNIDISKTCPKFYPR